MTLPIEEWTEWTKLLQGITELSAEIAVLRDRVQQRDAEIERLRESNRKLHRRCQEAEAALPDYRKLIALPPDGDGVRFVSGSMGRALLVSMCSKLQQRLDAANALLREAIGWNWLDEDAPQQAGVNTENPSPMDDLYMRIDAHLQGAGDE